MLMSVYGLEAPAVGCRDAAEPSGLDRSGRSGGGAALEQYRAKPAVSYSDCLVLEVARKAGHLPLCSFDRDLAKLNGAQRL